MKLGVRNNIEGTVTGIKKDGVMCQVQIKLTPGQEASLSSVMTIDSLEELGLSEGDAVKVLTKAVNVVVAK